MTAIPVVAVTGALPSLLARRYEKPSSASQNGERLQQVDFDEEPLPLFKGVIETTNSASNDTLCLPKSIAVLRVDLRVDSQT